MFVRRCDLIFVSRSVLRVRTCFCSIAHMLPIVPKDGELQRSVFSGRTRACTPVFFISAISLSTIAVMAGSPSLLIGDQFRVPETLDEANELPNRVLELSILSRQRNRARDSVWPRPLHRKSSAKDSPAQDHSQRSLDWSCFSRRWTTKMRCIWTLPKRHARHHGIGGMCVTSCRSISIGSSGLLGAPTISASWGLAP